MAEKQTDDAKPETKKADAPKVVRSMGTIDDIMTAKPIVMEVPAPELGKGKFLRVLMPSPDQLEETNARDYKLSNKQRDIGYLTRCARGCVVNERNEKMISAEQAKRMQTIAGIGHLLNRVFLVYMSGPTVTEDAVEAEVKNS